MQKIIEYRKRNFWSSQLDLESLNKQIFELNKDGWFVKAITPNTAFIGVVTSYTLLLESKD
ncbi:MAG: hypothetical protein HAW66_09180 [Shewanella sp.]|nr:hypothetical protein [Shewanella sp.]